MPATHILLTLVLQSACDPEQIEIANQEIERLFQQGQPGPATLILDRALSAACLQQAPVLKAALLTHSAVLYRLAGNRSRAFSNIEEALRLLREAPEKAPADYVLALNSYSELLSADKKTIEAKQPLDEALEACSRLQVSRPVCAKTRINYGLLFLQSADPDGAQRQLVRAFALMRPEDAPELHLSAWIASTLAHSLKGSVVEGDQASLLALQLAERLPPQHPLAQRAWDTRASFLAAAGRTREARDIRKRVRSYH